ncbi:MAG: O-antigen ligase family protein [Planctomycetota bacterium]
MNSHGLLPAQAIPRRRRLRFSERFAALLPVFALLLPAQLALHSPWQMAFNVGVSVFILAGLLLPVRVALPKYGAVETSLLVLLLSAAAISAFFNNLPRGMMVYGGIMGGYVAATRTVEYVKNPQAYMRLLILGFCCISIGIIIASFVIQPPTTWRYSGIYAKSNSMGWFGSSTAALMLGVLVYSRIKWKRWETIFIVSVLTLSLLLILVCQARSALAGICSSIGIFGVIFVHSFVMQSKARRKKLFFGLIFVAVVAGIAYWLGLFDRVIEKFEATASSGDLSNGRFNMWSVHLDNWKWFGNGAKYVSTYITHNTYVDHLTKYGVIPLALFLSFLGLLFYSGYVYTIKGTYQSAPILLSVITCFMAQAMFETGTSTPGLWIAIVFYCCLRYEIFMAKRGGPIRRNYGRQMGNNMWSPN